MQRSQLRDISSWMTRLFPEPGDGSSWMIDGFKMFGTKNNSPTSTFYTDLEITTDDKHEFEQREDQHSKTPTRLPEQQSTASEDGNSQDSDAATGADEQQAYVRHSFHRIASYGGFPRFQPFVMSASTPSECIDIARHEETSTETSYVKMSHSVLEYRSSRWVVDTLVNKSDYVNVNVKQNSPLIERSAQSQS